VPKCAGVAGLPVSCPDEDDVTALLIAVTGTLVLTVWFLMRRSVRVPCELDLEATEAHFHAHARLEGAEVNEGDEVLVHGAPDRIALGERRLVRAEATVTHVSLPRRALTRVLGTAHITDLYDVGFEG
jgi:hypothetical protein